MSIADINNAAAAYARTSQLTGGPQSSALSPAPQSPGATSDFERILSDTLGNTQQALSAAEATSQTVATGNADLVDVVTSISAAEVTLEAAIAVRNRVIEAYQEIMRLPI